MKLYLFITVVAFVLLSCEDKKKTSEEKIEQLKEVAIDTTKLPTKELEKKQVLEEEEIDLTYPKITSENVIPFFTQYGKDNPETKIKIATRLGDIYLRLFTETPLHRANFVYLVKQKYFDQTFFHRIVPNFIIQGGNSDIVSTPRKRAKLGKRYLIPAEISNHQKHVYGSLCGAKEYRENPDKQSMPFEFYIFLGKPSSANHLNGDYTIFGEVTKGMDVVETIANLPSDDGQWPLTNVYIDVSIVE